MNLNNAKGFIILAFTAFVGVFGFLGAGSMFERVDAGEIAVLQDPLDGEMHVWNQPGLYWQGFGQVTTYRKSEQVWFSAAEQEGGLWSQEVKTRFNDGGTAWITGSVRYDMPTNPVEMLDLHSKYGNHETVHSNLIVPTVDKIIYFTGPLMSSTESYAARRGELLEHVQDQLTNGVYKTSAHEEITVNVISGEETVVKITEILYDSNGQARRQEASPLGEFGVITRNLVLKGIRYEEGVQRQIDLQREMTMQIQTSKAKSLQAEQDAITAEEQGKADAATAKWEQEVVKATQVTQAERDKEVAELVATKDLEVQRLATEKARLYKVEQTLIGQGDGARKKAVMQADGALKQKLATYERVQAKYAEALGQHRLVPDVQFGAQTGSGNGSSAMSLIEMLMVKTAQDLSVDISTK